MSSAVANHQINLSFYSANNVFNILTIPRIAVLDQHRDRDRDRDTTVTATATANTNLNLPRSATATASTTATPGVYINFFTLIFF